MALNDVIGQIGGPQSGYGGTPGTLPGGNPYGLIPGSPYDLMAQLLGHNADVAVSRAQALDAFNHQPGELLSGFPGAHNDVALARYAQGQTLSDQLMQLMMKQASDEQQFRLQLANNIGQEASTGISGNAAQAGAQAQLDAFYGPGQSPGLGSIVPNWQSFYPTGGASPLAQGGGNDLHSAVTPFVIQAYANMFSNGKANPDEPNNLGGVMKYVMAQLAASPQSAALLAQPGITQAIEDVYHATNARLAPGGTQALSGNTKSGQPVQQHGAVTTGDRALSAGSEALRDAGIGAGVASLIPVPGVSTALGALGGGLFGLVHGALTAHDQPGDISAGSALGQLAPAAAQGLAAWGLGSVLGPAVAGGEVPGLLGRLPGLGSIGSEGGLSRFLPFLQASPVAASAEGALGTGFPLAGLGNVAGPAAWSGLGTGLPFGGLEYAASPAASTFGWGLNGLNSLAANFYG